MKNYVLLLTAILLIACGDISPKPSTKANLAVASPTTPVANVSAAAPKRSVLDDPVINARTLIRDDDKSEQWADEKDPRVHRTAKRIESISSQTGENAGTVMLAIGGAASRLKVTRVQLLADVDDAIAKGKLERGQGTTFGMDVWVWAMSKYKRS